MNLLDLVVVLGTVVAAAGGWKAGFLARVTSWVGVGVGFFVGVWVLPTVLEAIEASSTSTRLLVVVAVLVVAIFVGQAIGLVAGHRLRAVLPIGGARTADRSVGAVAGAFSVLIGLWLLLPTLADVEGWMSRQARGSGVARLVNGAFPDAPDTTQVVRRLVGDGFRPQVFDPFSPSPDAGAPPVDPGIDAAVVERVIASTVKVVGEACKRIQEGSGFVIGDDVVVTNAHVVAGEDEVDVMRPDGKRLRATVVVFDPRRDLAVLRIDRLGLPPLGRADGKSGQTGAVFGHPGGQAQVRAAPARISEEVTAKGSDIYGQDVTRQVFILASNLQPGDSGGPLVDGQGRVVGVAFAIAPDRPGTAYALTGRELDQAMGAYGRNPGARADTQSCVG